MVISKCQGFLFSVGRTLVVWQLQIVSEIQPLASNALQFTNRIIENKCFNECRLEPRKRQHKENYLRRYQTQTLQSRCCFPPGDWTCLHRYDKWGSLRSLLMWYILQQTAPQLAVTCWYGWPHISAYSWCWARSNRYYQCVYPNLAGSASEKSHCLQPAWGLRVEFNQILACHPVRWLILKNWYCWCNLIGVQFKLWWWKDEWKWPILFAAVLQNNQAIANTYSLEVP